MKNIFVLLVIGLLICSCTDEPDLNNYDVSILNNSNENLNIEAYLEGSLISSFNLSTNQSGLECSYTDESFRGYELTQCQIDSIVFQFGNGKGYISSINYSSTFNFTNDNHPFGPSDKFIISDNIYEFIITQEDFENANDLP